MGQLFGALLGAWLFFAVIVSPLINAANGKKVVVVQQTQMASVAIVNTKSEEVFPKRANDSMRKRIVERVPAEYKTFLGAASYALKEEASCRDVSDTDAETLAWGLIGHWKKENGLCLGLPSERCDVSSTGARGPMQFQPETWQKWGRDGDSDGIKNSETLADSAYAAAAFLCDLRRKTGSWGHAMCRYYGDNVNTCVYERRVRKGIETIETVLQEEEERKRLEAEAAKNKKPSMTLSKVKSTQSVH